MHKIVVKFLGGDNIGEIFYQAPENKLVIKAFLPEYQSELDDTVRTICQKQLTMITGITETGPGQETHKTIAHSVLPGTPEYLAAIADALTRSVNKIRGRRVRGYLME